MKSDLAKVSLALLSVVFLLGCQDVGPVGPDGLVPQFDKPSANNPNCEVPDEDGHCHGGGDGGGCGKHCVFVDVELTGWMKTDPLTEKNQMELARKGDIIKLRANGDKVGTEFLEFAIDMTNTLAALTFGSDLEKQRNSLNTNCKWSGRVEQTVDNEKWVINIMLPRILHDTNVIPRSVLVAIDESALGLVSTDPDPDVYVGVSDDNRMNILPGFFVRGGSPEVTVVGDPAGSDFMATFSGGKVELAGSPPGERNEIHLSCNIMDDITFKVMSQTS